PRRQGEHIADGQVPWHGVVRHARDQHQPHAQARRQPPQRFAVRPRPDHQQRRARLDRGGRLGPVVPPLLPHHPPPPPPAPPPPTPPPPPPPPAPAPRRSGPAPAHPRSNRATSTKVRITRTRPATDGSPRTTESAAACAAHTIARDASSSGCMTCRKNRRC